MEVHRATLAAKIDLAENFILGSDWQFRVKDQLVSLLECHRCPNVRGCTWGYTSDKNGQVVFDISTMGNKFDEWNVYRCESTIFVGSKIKTTWTNKMNHINERDERLRSLKTIEIS